MFFHKRNVVFYFCLFSVLFLRAQQDSIVSKYFVDASVNYGYIIAHHPYLANLETGHTRGVDIAFCRHSNPQSDWGREYQYPDCGIGFSFFDLRNPKLLGDAASVYSCAYFPVSRNKNFKWTIKIAYGLGYVQKSFNRTGNYKNTAIGSHLNAFLQLSNLMAYQFNSYNKLTLGISFSHFSNGSFEIPNLGINIPAFQLSYGRYFGKQQFNKSAVKKSYLPKKWQQYVYGSFALKETDPIEGPKYEVYTLGYENVKYTSRKCGFGAGAEIIYDSSLRHLLAGEQIYKNDVANIKAGLYGRFALRMGNMEADADVGGCLFTSYKNDGYIYSKFELRRYFNDKYYIGINLKTHFAVADYFALSTGVKI